MGRPPISAEGAKATVLIVRVSPEEKATIEAAAQRADVNVSEWVRSTLLAASQPTQGGGARAPATKT